MDNESVSSRPPLGHPTLTMSALGKMGRFGNQIFQYAFLRLCARASGADYQCPAWPGQHLFGHADPLLSVSLQPLIEGGPGSWSIFDEIPEFIPYIAKVAGMTPGRIGPDALVDGAPPGDLIGFFQWHTSYLRPHRSFFRSLFQPCEDMRQWLEEPLEALRQRGKTIIAVHLRSGDYRWLPQLGFTLLVPARWWVEWLDAHWSELDEPVLYLCSDNPAALRRSFDKYKPLSAADLRLAPPARLEGTGVEFFRDFHAMTQADVLGISNSTFSFTAAMMNERATMFVRPHWDFATRFAQFDPWDSEPLLYQGGGNRRFFKDYKAMLQVARATGGLAGMLSSALLYHPVGSILIRGARLALAHGDSVPFIRNLFSGRQSLSA